MSESYSQKVCPLEQSVVICEYGNQYSLIRQALLVLDLLTA